MNSQLNPNARKWVAALRSGDYKQGRGQLHRVKDGRMCCLGVACDLFIKSGGKLEVGKNDRDVTYGGAMIALPSPVKNWLGISSGWGRMRDGQTLCAKNDRGASFAQIANLIESKPEGLFVE